MPLKSGRLRKGLRNTSTSVDILPNKDSRQAHYDWSKEDGSMPVQDRSGNGYALNNGGYTGVNTSIGGRQAGEFDGTDDHLYSAAYSSAISQPYTIFVVYQRDGSGNDREYATGGHPSGDSAAIVGSNWNGAVTLFSGNVFTGNAASDTNAHITGGVFDGASSEIRIDGATDATGDVGARNLLGSAVGANSDNTNNQFGGAIGEILYYSTGPSNLDISGIESHLSDKWDITI